MTLPSAAARSSHALTCTRSRTNAVVTSSSVRGSERYDAIWGHARVKMSPADLSEDGGALGIPNDGVDSFTCEDTTSGVESGRRDACASQIGSDSDTSESNSGI